MCPARDLESVRADPVEVGPVAPASTLVCVEVDEHDNELDKLVCIYIYIYIYIYYERRIVASFFSSHNIYSALLQRIEHCFTRKSTCRLPI